MPDPLLLIIESVLAATLLWAVVAKVTHLRVWSQSLSGYGFEGPMKRVVAVAVPVAEAVVATMLLVGPIRVGLAATLFLVSAFSFGILQARSRSGDRVPCGCFGKTEERDYRWLLVRNLVLAVLAGAALIGGAEEAIVELTELPSATEVLPAVLVTAGAVLLAWLGWQLVHLIRKEHP